MTDLQNSGMPESWAMTLYLLCLRGKVCTTSACRPFILSFVKRDELLNAWESPKWILVHDEDRLDVIHLLGLVWCLQYVTEAWKVLEPVSGRDNRSWSCSIHFFFVPQSHLFSFPFSEASSRQHMRVCTSGFPYVLMSFRLPWRKNCRKPYSEHGLTLWPRS